MNILCFVHLVFKGIETHCKIKQRWDVKPAIGSKGYQIQIGFQRNTLLCISLHDMQLLYEVCPLRIDAIFVSTDKVRYLHTLLHLIHLVQISRG